MLSCILFATILLVILFLMAVYAHDLKIAFLILLIIGSLILFYIEELRIKECEKKCKSSSS